MQAAQSRILVTPRQMLASLAIGAIAMLIIHMEIELRVSFGVLGLACVGLAVMLTAILSTRFSVSKRALVGLAGLALYLLGLWVLWINLSSPDFSEIVNIYTKVPGGHPIETSRILHLYGYSINS